MPRWRASLFVAKDRTTQICRTQDRARVDVFDDIELFYYVTRRHSTVGYLRPVELERLVGFGLTGAYQTSSVGGMTRPAHFPYPPKCPKLTDSRLRLN